jgi:hypothetical protein
MKGIEMRLLVEVTDADISSWITFDRMIHKISRTVFERFKAVGYETGSQRDAPQLRSDAAAAFESDAVNARIFFLGKANTAINIADILPQIVQQYPGWSESVPADGRRVPRDVRVRFRRGELIVPGTEGDVEIAELQLGFDLYIETIETSLQDARHFQYGEQDSQIQHSEYSVMGPFGRPMSLSVTRQADSQILNIGLRGMGSEASLVDINLVWPGSDNPASRM